MNPNKPDLSMSQEHSLLIPVLPPAHGIFSQPILSKFWEIKPGAILPSKFHSAVCTSGSTWHLLPHVKSDYLSLCLVSFMRLKPCLTQICILRQIRNKFSATPILYNRGYPIEGKYVGHGMQTGGAHRTASWVSISQV